MKKILLQSSIPFDEDDWHIGRFSLLTKCLEQAVDRDGAQTNEVVARDRDPGPDGVDTFLASIDRSDFDQIWLMAADAGNGFSQAECASLSRFHRSGGALVVARDHHDLGASICNLERVGPINYFHSTNPDPIDENNTRDDDGSPEIDFPNYHSGRNGDFQKIVHFDPVHPLFYRSDGSLITHFPSHPHEGGIGCGAGSSSERVIAKGKSKITGREFNLVVQLDAVENDEGSMTGRSVVHSSFHHFSDYNWDVTFGAPSFVTDPPGDGFISEPERLDDIRTYVTNLAAWL